MRIGISTIRNIMRNGTDERVSTTGIVLMGNAVEDFIVKKTREAKKRLDEINSFRRLHNLPEIKTINEEIFREVLDESYKNT